MATVSFAETSYRVSEGTGTLVVNITRSGDTNIVATVLAASDNFEGTASGIYIPLVALNQHWINFDFPFIYHHTIK